MNEADAERKEGPLETAILFVDLVSSSEFASVMGLREYAEYVQSFNDLCIKQCNYFFREFKRKSRYIEHDHFEIRALGDELVVYLHSGHPQDDVYQLVCLAITLKCAWLCNGHNRERLDSGMSCSELAAGIHHGPVWATRTEHGYERAGFAINLAKRAETVSREGERFRIFLTDRAFTQINLRMRTMLFGPRQLLPMKGIVIPVGVRELVEAFVDAERRMHPDFAPSFRQVARQALDSTSFDLWIHSCLQVAEEQANGGTVSDEMLELCRHVLNMEPTNAVALYYAAQGHRERDDLETARLYSEDLTRQRPTLGDGWLELGELLKKIGESKPARDAFLRARRHGIDVREEDMPNI